LPGRIEENQKNLSQAQIRTEHLTSTGMVLELLRDTSLLGVTAFDNAQIYQWSPASALKYLMPFLFPLLRFTYFISAMVYNGSA
jgi:hypothetical protein